MLHSFMINLPKLEGAGRRAFVLLFFIHDTQGAGRRTQAINDPVHAARPQARNSRTAPAIDPIYKDAGRRAETQDAPRSSVEAPPNKYRSPWQGSCSKKKETPPQRLCAECHAICDLDTETRLFFIIFNSTHNGTPSIQI